MCRLPGESTGSAHAIWVKGGGRPLGVSGDRREISEDLALGTAYRLGLRKVHQTARTMEWRTFRDRRFEIATELDAPRAATVSASGVNSDYYAFSQAIAPDGS